MWSMTFQAESGGECKGLLVMSESLSMVRPHSRQGNAPGLLQVNYFAMVAGEVPSPASSLVVNPNLGLLGPL